MKNRKKDLTYRNGFVMDAKDRMVFEAIGGFLIIGSVVSFNMLEMTTAFILGALGAVVWLVVALDARLFGLAALNITLFLINLNGAL